MNFLEVKNLVKSYLNREDLDTYIPLFINAAIKKLENSLSLLDMSATTFGTLTEEETSITVPDNFKSVNYLSIKLDSFTSNTLKPLDVYLYKTMCNFDNKSTPRFFTVLKDVIKVYPLPDKEYAYEMGYYFYSDELSQDQDKNFWTEKYWPLLVYASLLEAEPFIINDQRLVAWKAFYDDAISKLLTAEIEKEYPGPMKIRGKHLDF